MERKDKQTVYLKNVITDSDIEVGDDTIDSLLRMKWWDRSKKEILDHGQ